MLRTAIEDCSYRKLIVRSPASWDAATLQPFLDVPGDEFNMQRRAALIPTKHWRGRHNIQ
jgi:hypothetical protein